MDAASTHVYVAAVAALSMGGQLTQVSAVAVASSSVPSTPSAPALASAPSTLYDPAVHAETRLESAEVHVYGAAAPASAAVAAFDTGGQVSQKALDSAPQALAVYVPGALHTVHALHVPAAVSL